MKNFKRSLPICLISIISLFGLVSETNAQDFEGVIFYEIPEMAAQGMGEMPYMVKGEQVRMEFGKGTQGGALIFMPESNQMVFILESLKGYMTLEVDDPTANAGTANGGEDENTRMDKTGETKNIAGRTCEVWQVTDAENTFRLCVAKGLGNFMMPKNPMAQSNTPEWAKEAIAGGFMPLEVIEINDENSELKMRATSIEEKSLSDSLFQIPEGYNDMSSMMKQMMDHGNN